MIGIFLCAEDGVEVYPRQGKSIFPHQKYRLSFWTVGIFLFREDGVEVYPPKEEIHLPPPKIPIVLLDGRYFSFPGRCTNARQMHGAEKNLERLRQHREGKPHMIRPPTPWAGFCCSAPLTLPVRSGARPAPAATGRPRACQSNRRTPSARRARTATGTHLPTPAAAQNTPHIAASAFLPSGCKIIMHLDNFRS